MSEIKRENRERRERIATMMLTRLVSPVWDATKHKVVVINTADAVSFAVTYTDALIVELDKG